MNTLLPLVILEGKALHNKPKQRQRVPLSCLNCKKRKVKCDKSRPSCGGCIRNNVAHLCVYKDPPWLKDQTISATPDSEVASPSDVRSKQTDSVTSLTYQRQIDELRRQIQFWQSLPSFLRIPVTFLRRLCPSEIHSALLLKVDEAEGYTVSSPSSSSNHKQHAHLYSWISLIKLDPQLEALWYKITKLLTVYHQYKASLEIKETEHRVPVPRKLPKGIREIDFTDATHSITPNRHQCPVIECDFVLESGKEKASFSSGSDSNLSSDQSSSSSSSSPEPNQLLRDLFETAWSNTLTLGSGEHLKYQQLYFLIEYYFNRSYRCQSYDILNFYKKDILALVRHDGSSVKYNNVLTSSNELLRSSIYLCMLSLIIQEALGRLQDEVLDGSYPAKVRTLFPKGISLQGPETQDRIVVVHNILLKLGTECKTSLAYVAVQVSLLNYIVSVHGMQHASPRAKQVFTSSLKSVLHLVTRDGYADVSRDPDLVQVAGNVYNRRNTQLKLHFCYLWVNLVRLANLATLNFVSLSKYPTEVTSLLDAFATKIQAAKLDDSHSKYLEKTGESSSLKKHLRGLYLTSEIMLAISRATTAYGSPHLVVTDVCVMIQSCQEWLDNHAEPRLREELFESFASISFLDCYLNYILLLHGEGTLDDNVIMICVPKIFTSLYDLLSFLKSCAETPPDLFLQPYAMLAIVEMLARLIQLVMGLLMRIHNQDTAQTYTLLRDSIRKHNIQISHDAISTAKVSVLTFVEIHLVDLVNISLVTLQKSQHVDQVYCDKLSKMWRFYVTFVSNSRKMLSVDYAKVHSNVPLFKSEPLNVRGCPVFQSDGTPKPAYGQGKGATFRKCPILHIMSPMSLETERELGGVGRITPPLMAERGLVKRKCPFNHSLAERKPKPKCPYLDTKARQTSHAEVCPTVCPVNHGSISYTDDMPVRQSKVPHIANSKPFSSQPCSPQVPPLPDLSSFMEHNLDFDFLQNDALLEQMSLVNDLDVRGPFMNWNT